MLPECRRGVAWWRKIRLLCGRMQFDWKHFDDAWAREARSRDFTARTLVDTPAGPLQAWEKPGCGPRIYLSAGIHGDEPAGPLAALELLQCGFFDGNAQWWVCPSLNPVGLAAGTRGNGSGQDLNRDYWLRETPEVQAHAAWLESLAVPDLFLSLHEDWEARGFYFYEINLLSDQPGRAAAILSAVAREIPVEQDPLVDGHPVRQPGWIYHEAEADLPGSWPEAIFLAKRGCPLSFTMETPSHAATLDARVRALAAATRAAHGAWLATRPRPE